MALLYVGAIQVLDDHMTAGQLSTFFMFASKVCTA